MSALPACFDVDARSIALLSSKARCTVLPFDIKIWTRSYKRLDSPNSHVRFPGMDPCLG